MKVTPVKVTRINGYHLRFVPRLPLGNARGFIRTREFLALEIETDAGVTGWGEAFSSPWAAAGLIRSLLGRVVLGQSADHYGRLFNEMLGLINYDRRGAAMMAISALDVALHDAAARGRGVSVAQMLGGALHQRLPAYASGPFIREGEAPYAHFNAEAEDYLEQGFRMMKPRAGVSPRADGAMIKALRGAVGDEVGLMVDINQGYTPHAAIASARAMEEGRLLWIEEPVQPEDIAGYVKVSQAVPMAVSGGEALGSLAAFRDFLEASAISILQPDMGVCGGFSGFARIAHLAAAYDLPVMPHVFSTTINFHAGLQMAALIPARKGGGPMPYPYVEYDSTGNPLIELCGFPIAKDGYAYLPQGPGLGIELTASMLEPWTVERWSMALP
jgi:D-galactarolactone cycloisomerase